MDVPPGLADVLADVLDERDDVVVADRLDLGDPGDVEGGLLLDLGEVLDRHLLEPDPGLDGQDLDLEPPGELRALREDGRHLLAAVTGDHAGILFEVLSRPRAQGGSV